MPALNFTLQSKIAWILDPCRQGEGQTIRPVGKRIFRPGGELYLYAHQRSKNCRKLGEAVCRAVVPITLKYSPTSLKKLRIYGERVCCISYNDFSRLDGFNDYSEFEQFFINTYKLKSGDSLDMNIIKWKDFKQLGVKG